jgi:hypothetical protein
MIKSHLSFIWLFKKYNDTPGMVVHIHNPSTWDAETSLGYAT